MLGVNVTLHVVLERKVETSTSEPLKLEQGQRAHLVLTPHHAMMLFALWTVFIHGMHGLHAMLRAPMVPNPGQSTLQPQQLGLEPPVQCPQIRNSATVDPVP